MPEARVDAIPPIVASAPGSTGNIRPGILQRLRELQAGDAGFDRRVQVLRADAHDVVHLAQIDGDAAVQRVHVSLERGAGAERHDRDC